MRVLVTGHEGYVGTVLCDVLTVAGHDVVGLDVGLFADCLLGPMPSTPPALRCDVRDITPLQLGGFHAVVHLAALSNDALGDLKPELTYAINHGASIRLAEAAREAGVRRFLYASTCSVYGAAETDDAVAEDAPLAPVTHYAASKVMVESDLQVLSGEDFEPVYLRSATAFGYSPRMRGDIVVNEFVASAYLTGRIRVLSDGTPWRPLAHVRDIAGAFLAALEAPRERVHNVAINVGSEHGNVRVAEIAEIVAGLTGADLEITGETGPDPRSYRVDFARLRERLPAFNSRWTIERGVHELLSVYDRYGLTAEAAFSRYRRLAWVQSLQAAGRVDRELRWTRSRECEMQP